MSRSRSGIAAELVPLALVLATLAGSLALIVSVHRRVANRRPALPSTTQVAVTPPSPESSRPLPLPDIPSPVPVAVEPVAIEPEPSPAPIPEDPTPKAIARLVSAEAEQLLEASKADRQVAALEVARKAAQADSERWRRRESLVRLQLDAVDAKVRKLETEVDELALERDALEKERDARKAMASQDRSRPGQAILPHRGVNGTWRRPIVVECTNGMAILRPQGIGFGLLELATGFSPKTNPFVAMIAHEAIRIQGNVSPDGQAVVPYIFFLVRPDGIRAYYEARGRLEPLGITFGYELADQDWDIDFPDLDDVKTWDGSGPSRPKGLDPLAQTPGNGPGQPTAEDDSFPPWGTSGRGGRTALNEAPGGEFTWPAKPRTAVSGGGSRINLGDGNGSRSKAPRTASPVTIPDGPDPLGGPPPLAARPLPTPGDPSNSGIPGELSLGNQPITILEPTSPKDGTSRPNSKGVSPPGGAAFPNLPQPAPGAGGQAVEKWLGGGGSNSPGSTRNDPLVVAEVASGPTETSSSVQGSGRDDPSPGLPRPSQPRPSPRPPGPGDSGTVDSGPPIRHSGPFARPLAGGLDSLTTSDGPPSTTANPGSPNDAELDPTRPDGTTTATATATAAGGSPTPTRAGGVAAGSPSGVRGSSGSQASSRVAGSSDATGTPSSGSTPPPPQTFSLGMTGAASSFESTAESPTSKSASERSPTIPDFRSTPVADRRFEIVVVCGPKGVIVQPGGYRVTASALKDRDGLMKKQMVALVKARRTADPKVNFEPRVRFLVQSGGEKSFWAARSQFLLSGLNWPMSTQVADPDHLSIIPSESW